MTSPRLLLLALAGAICVGLAIYTLSDREPKPGSAEANATESKAAGVGRRPSDAPFDLRDRDGTEPGRTDQATPAQTAEAQPTQPDERERIAPTEPPPTVVAPPGSSTIEATIAATTKAAEKAVAEARSDMRRKCWDTIDRGGVGDDGVELGFSLSFNAEGHVLASAVQQPREAYIQGLDTCLGPLAHALQVPAPGEPVSVDVKLSLP